MARPDPFDSFFQGFGGGADPFEEMSRMREQMDQMFAQAFGRFHRSLTLPGPVDAERMNAAYKDGVLTVTVPKAEQIPAKRHMTI
jgi:HSP20 family protein